MIHEHLSEKHLEDLRKSGLRDDTISACKFRTESDPERIARFLNWEHPARILGACLCIPFYGPDGTFLEYVWVKPDKPRAGKNGKKPPKYESPAKKSNRVYFPPLTRGAILDDATLPLLITEGEKKAAKADQEGFRCLGLVGVYGFQKKREKNDDGYNDAPRELIEDLQSVVWEGRTIFIAYDSDAIDNRNVRLAEWHLSETLAAVGAVVKVVRIPAAENGSKQGIDDFLVAEGNDAFAKLLCEATPATAPMQPWDEPDNPHRLAEGYLKVLRSESELRCYNGTFYRWELGGYRMLLDQEIDGPLREWVRTEFIRYAEQQVKAYENAKRDFDSGKITEEPKEPKPIIKVSNALMGNVLGALRSIVRVPSELELPSWLGNTEGRPEPHGLLPARNGILELGSGKLHPLTTCFFNTNVLPFDYNPKAPSPIEWLKFLNQLWPYDHDAVACLQEWFGYLLTTETRLQKILLLIGPKRSGKGTIFRIMNSLVGPGNVAAPTLGGLAGNFGLQPLLGKSVAMVSDARLSGRSDMAPIVERLLSISGEDIQTVDRKHQSTVTGKLPVRFVLASNELPKLNDASGALSGRFIILALTTSFFGREDPKLTDRLMTELPGILLWAIEGWKRLNARGKFLQPASGAELLCELEDLSSPIGEFVRDKCMLGSGFRIPICELYSSWRVWCEEHGRREPGTEQSFGRDLRAAVSGLKTKRKFHDGERWREYEGIRLRTSQDVEFVADNADSPPEGEALASLSATKTTVRQIQNEATTSKVLQEGREDAAMEVDADTADNGENLGALYESPDLDRYKDFWNH